MTLYIPDCTEKTKRSAKISFLCTLVYKPIYSPFSPPKKKTFSFSPSPSFFHNKMSQSQKNYFTLTQQKPIKSGLLNRRQQQAGYLQPLELPSLPPLSQLLPTNNSNNNDKDSSKTKTDSTNNAAVEAAAAAAAAAAASVAGMIPASTNTFAPQQTTTIHPGQFQLNSSSNPILVNNNPSTTADMVAAAAAAASMMSFDPMYAMPTQPGLTTDPVTIINPIEFNNQIINQRTRQSSNASNSSVEKVYSFVEIPGTNQKKRPRRRYDEIERLYHCNWPGCTKAYGTLNHLNAHVSMQKHVIYPMFTLSNMYIHFLL